MTLHYDIARCHNVGCPEKETCVRWLDRDTGQVHFMGGYDDITKKCECYRGTTTGGEQRR